MTSAEIRRPADHTGPCTVTSGRPVRTELPHPSASVIALAAPPRQSESPAMSGSMGMILVPAASGVGAALLAVTHQDRPLMAAAGLLVLAASIAVGLGMLMGSRTGARRRTRAQRERYLDYLEQVRLTLRDAADRQRSADVRLHPDPVEAAGLAFVKARRWERRPGDPDFLQIRIGRGQAQRRCAVDLSVDGNDPLVSYEPVCLAAARELVDSCGPLEDQPVCLSVAIDAVTCVTGPTAAVRGTARALIAQVLWAHSPAEVGVLVCGRSPTTNWDWVKWLPHTHSAHQRDGPLPFRMVAGTAEQAQEMLRRERIAPPDGHGRRLVVIVDLLTGPPLTATQEAAWSTAAIGGAHLVYLIPRGADEPELVHTRVVIGDRGVPDGDNGTDAIEQYTAAGSEPTAEAGAPGTARGSDALRALISSRCRLDRLNEAQALTVARSFAPLRPVDEGGRGADRAGAPSDHRPIGDPASIDPARDWRHRHVSDLLRAPIGTGVDGSPIVLDLKEAAAGGMGPHGLIVGATGSGKSELLRTLVTALAIRHPPEVLALLLVDFKGGATFTGLSALPHLTGMVTNLEDDKGFVDRFRDALGGELLRRQELLAAAGRVSSIAAYRELRRHRTELEAVPDLLVIIDEFSELLGARPDLAELFVTVGRIGRSIGIHLLLSTQRLDAGRIRGLESHLSYRICLRTFSEAESREAMGGPDAHGLPAEPGWGYLVGDGPVPRRFRVAMVSAAAQERRGHPPFRTALPLEVRSGVGARSAELHRQLSRYAPISAAADKAAPDQGSGPSVLELAVDRLVVGARGLATGRPARRIWLEPLPERLTLAELRVPDHDPADRVIAAFGLVDLPERQRQQLLEWDITDGNTNLLIVGTGRSGKSTAVLTLAAALCLRYPPGVVELLVIDNGGQLLMPLSTLPHVAAVGSRSDPDLTRLIFTRVSAILVERELLFRQHHFTGPADLRAARRDGIVDPSVSGDVVLLIDDWVSVRGSAEELEAILYDILVRGPGLGVHTVLTAAAAHHLRARIASSFGTRIELRPADGFDSAIDRAKATAIPPKVPGRALVTGAHYAQVALPLLDPTPSTSADGRGTDGPTTGSVADTVARIRRRWPHPPIPRIQTLPLEVTLEQLSPHPDPGAAGRRNPELLLGEAEDGMRPIRWDPVNGDPHLIAFGDARSGKTNLLQSVLQQLAGTWPTTEVAMEQTAGRPDADREGEVIVIDYRRRLAESPAGGHWSFAGSGPDAAKLCSGLAERLTRNNEAQQGRPSFVIVDDYDLVATATGNPLRVLMPFLPRSADLNVHLILTRRVGGAARAQFEPVLQALSDLGTPVLLFSGPSTEGRLAHGVAPRPLPPGRALLTTRDRAPQLVQTPVVRVDRPRSPPVE